MATKKEESVVETIVKKTLNFRGKLSAIQTKIKAPKNLFNKFGKYNYRNAEGILEAVKPYLDHYGLYLLIHDEIESIGDRFYVKAVVELGDCETGDSIQAFAYAREVNEKSGMDGSQITGAASSYARKYALNGLFLLDDTKDADTDEYHEATNKEEKPTEESLKDDLKKLWIQASGSDEGFEEYYVKAKGNTNQGYATIKAQLLKKLNDKKEANA